MWKLCLAVCVVVCALGAGSQAADLNDDGANGQGAPARFSSLRNMLGQPDGTMYSQGGYAPAAADGCGCNGGGNAELDSPNGCAGLWSGYRARPCGPHRHFANTGSGWGGGFGGGFGGPLAYGGLGCGCGCGAPIASGCGCGASMASGCGCGCRHHCKLFGKHCHRNACGCGAPSCDTCQSGGAMIDGSPSDGGPSMAPTPAPESVQPAPEKPGPSAERAPRRFRPLASLGVTKS